MGEDHHAQVLGTGAEFHADCALLNQFCSAWANHVDAQYAVSLGISDDFDKTTGVVSCHGTARSGKREGADVNFNAFSFQLLFVLADPCNFRVGVDNRWDQVVVHLGSCDP